MTLLQNPMTRLVVALSLLLLLLGGCSQDDVASPVSEQDAIAADPLDDVLKSTDGQTPADPEARLTRLAEVLGLDEDQLAALTVAYMTFRDGVADLRSQVEAGELTVQEAREAAALLRDAFEAELQIILTAEQWDLLQEMRPGAHGPHGNHHGQPDPAARWTDWLTEIGADEDQVTAVFAALEVRRDAMQDLREQVRLGEVTHEEARVIAEALRADFNTALQTILTEEQYAALLELRPDCNSGNHGGNHGGGHGDQP